MPKAIPNIELVLFSVYSYEVKWQGSSKGSLSKNSQIKLWFTLKLKQTENAGNMLEHLVGQSESLERETELLIQVKYTLKELGKWLTNLQREWGNDR